MIYAGTKEIKTAFIGINGTLRKIDKIYLGVNGLTKTTYTKEVHYEPYTLTIKNSQTRVLTPGPYQFTLSGGGGGGGFGISRIWGGATRGGNGGNGYTTSTSYTLLVTGTLKITVGSGGRGGTTYGTSSGSGGTTTINIYDTKNTLLYTSSARGGERGTDGEGSNGISGSGGNGAAGGAGGAGSNVGWDNVVVGQPGQSGYVIIKYLGT